MAKCGQCNQEMTTATSCVGGIDEKIIGKLLPQDFKDGKPRRCGDCGVTPGGDHHPGCDVERCSVCGRQAIQGCEHIKETWCSVCQEGEQYCECAEPKPARHSATQIHDPAAARWTGLWPGVQYCRDNDLWCHDLLDGVPVDARHLFAQGRERKGTVTWHVPCLADAPFAHEDLNRAAVHRRAV